jgi:ubiquinone/menaquinone biosynthesis C-methylase UbiE
MDDPNALIQQQFGAHANDYITSQVHAQGQSLQRLVELTQPKRDWLVLDVSTGAGHTALTFAPHVARVIACDLTPQMLDAARKLANERGIANVDFKPADAHSLPFEENMFDLVTNRIALHHYTDARKTLAEMVRVCKLGGIIALDDNIVPPDKQTAGYINHFEKLRDPSHNWAYPSARLEAMMSDAGLKIEHSETMHKEMEFGPWADRMGASAETKEKLRQMLLEEAPPAAKEFWSPRIVGDKLYFSLTEAIIIGKKS